MRVQLWLVALLSAASAGCETSPTVDTELEAAAIRQRFAAWVQAEVRKDMEGSLAFMAPDIVLQPEGAPATIGLQAARDMYKALFEIPYTAVPDVEPRTVLVARSGDLASDIGSWELHLADGSVQPGKSAIVWQKRDGKWLAIAMSFSMDAPPATAATAPATP